MAQQPFGGAPGGAPGEAGPMAGASFLLAHTGDLQLNDQQVVKLAAIARRQGAQRKAMRASMDSLRQRMMGARRDSAGRNAARARMQPSTQQLASMTRAREQVRTDLRDAISILTPDQQGQAWQMISARGAMGRGGMRRGRMGGGMGGGMGGMTGPGRGMNRGPGRPGDGAQPGQPGQPGARMGRPAPRPPEEGAPELAP
jgi:hypothetical protein